MESRLAGTMGARQEGRGGTADAGDPLAAEARDAQALGERPLSARELGVGGAGVVVAVAAATVVIRGGAPAAPAAYAAVLVVNVLTLTLAGLMWLRARPWSPLGRLLVVFALMNALDSLAGSSAPSVYSAGVLVQWLTALTALWLIVAFPSGRLDRGGRAVIGLGAATFLLGEVPKVLLARSIPNLPPLGRCTANCPANGFLVADRPDLAHAFTLVESVGRAAVAAAALAYLWRRFARASRPRRRTLLPVYVVSVPLVAAFGLNALLVDAFDAGPSTALALRYALTIARLVFPFGFIAAILLARAHAGTALGEMARRLGTGPSVGEVEELVRRVLDDPRSRLVFWLPRSRVYVDRRGNAVALDPAAEWLTWRRFERDGQTVLVLEHDPALGEDPELVDAVGAATVMALDNRRLQQDLLDSIAALRASQRRLSTAAAAERRKIERDLHDSAQQQLVAIRIQIELAREQALEENALRRRLGAIGADVDRALDDLRSVAHGIYPSLLAVEGLPAALTEAARRAGVRVELVADGIGRLPEGLESAVYYCCLEALQNASKHGGDGVTVSVRLWRQGRDLRFTVSDDGAGFATRRRPAGRGVTSMYDRIVAVGGMLTVHSEPGGGTTVDGRVPGYAGADEESRVVLR